MRQGVKRRISAHVRLTSRAAQTGCIAARMQRGLSPRPPGRAATAPQGDGFPKPASRGAGAAARLVEFRGEPRRVDSRLSAAVSRARARGAGPRPRRDRSDRADALAAQGSGGLRAGRHPPASRGGGAAAGGRPRQRRAPPGGGGRGRRPRAARRRGGAHDPHADAGRHGAARRLPAARATAASPAGAAVAPPRRVPDRGRGLPPRCGRLLRGRSGDRRGLSAHRRRDEPEPHVRGAPLSRRHPGPAVAERRAVPVPVPAAPRPDDDGPGGHGSRPWNRG